MRGIRKKTEEEQRKERYPDANAWREKGEKESVVDRESKGGAALTSKRAKREQESENGRTEESEGAGCAGRRRRRGGKEGTRESDGGSGWRARGRGPRAERRGRESDGKNQ